MSICRWCFFWLVLPASLVGLLYPRSSAPGPVRASTTFQKNVRVVLLDVVVTDRKDNPVEGLKAENFQAFEDGKPQAISYFEEHKSAPVVQVKLPAMPPNVFTNFPAVTPPDTINVLLLDALNTALTDQAYVHTEIVKYLKNIQPGTQVAIFTLGSRLRFVQGFTTDSSVLLAALNDKKRGASPQLSPLLPNTMDDNADQQRVSSTASASGLQGAVDALQQFQHESSAFQLDFRINTTLQAFDQLAHYLGAFPGRKNIIWFSGLSRLAFSPTQRFSTRPMLCANTRTKFRAPPTCSSALGWRFTRLPPGV